MCALLGIAWLWPVGGKGTELAASLCACIAFGAIVAFPISFIAAPSPFLCRSLCLKSFMLVTREIYCTLVFKAFILFIHHG